jgi:hypothetical protein
LARKIYTHVASIISKMSKLLFLSTKQIEEIWETMKYILSHQQHYLKNCLLDVVLLNVISLVMSSHEENRKPSSEINHGDFKNDYNEILCKFHGISFYTTFNLFEYAYEKAYENFNKNDINLIEEYVYNYKNNIKNVNDEKNLEISPQTIKCMEINCSYMSYLLNLQEEYSVILSISPNARENKSPNQSDFLNNKRIRPLTPPLENKTMTSSPYKNKNSNIPFSSSTISAFKDLNNAFSYLSKGGDS